MDSSLLKMERAARGVKYSFCAAVIAHLLALIGENHTLYFYAHHAYDLIMGLTVGPILLWYCWARLVYLQRSLLWLILLLFSQAILPFAVYKHNLILGFIALAVFLATFLPLYFLKPRDESTLTEVKACNGQKS